MRVWIAVLLAWLCFGGSALAEKKLALVIGNDAYQHIDALRKARADAKSYADLLREKGFSVEDRYDLGIVDMQAAVGEFVEKIEPGDTAVFVYSGHGWSDGAHNYLLGVDVPDRASQDLLKQLSLPIRNGATGILDVFDGKRAGLKVAIIDACRDSPFQPPAGPEGLRPRARLAARGHRGQLRRLFRRRGTERDGPALGGRHRPQQRVHSRVSAAVARGPAAARRDQGQPGEDACSGGRRLPRSDPGLLRRGPGRGLSVGRVHDLRRPRPQFVGVRRRLLGDHRHSDEPRCARRDDR